MKIAIVLVLCLAAGSQASFLDDLKNAFSNVGSALTTTVHAVGDQAKVVGQNLLSTAAEQGKQLASQALQSERTQKLLAFQYLLYYNCFMFVLQFLCCVFPPPKIAYGLFLMGAAVLTYMYILSWSLVGHRSSQHLVIWGRNLSFTT